VRIDDHRAQSYPSQLARGGVHEEELVASLDVVTVASRSGAAPLPVGFDGSASTAVGGTIATWEWDFGDGTTGSGATALHTYTTPGEYFASLTVTDSNGHVNLVPLLQQVDVFDGTMPTATPAATPTFVVVPTPTVAPPPGSTATRTATPVIVATPTPTASPTPTLGLVVTTTADNGDDASPVPGSLRQAILTANAKANPVGGVDVITFNIPGAGVHTIAPPQELPFITDPVTIDGYTQPGASPNTLVVGNDAVLLIEINLELAYATFPFLRGPGGSTIRGLVINRFREQAIAIVSDNNVIEGCFIGTNAAGDTRLLANGSTLSAFGAIFVAQGADNRIGGTLPAARNVIEANGDVGIRVSDDNRPVGVSNTVIQGNYIGTNAAGTAAVNAPDNGRHIGVGIVIGGANTLNTIVGGTEPGAGNLISGNGGAVADNEEEPGIIIGSPDGTGDVTIQGNLIGTNAAGTAAIGNHAGGIRAVSNGTITRLVIGGPQSGARNVIAGNGFDGLAPGGAVSAGITIYAPVLNGAIVQGNFIGVGSDGVTLIPNFVDGIGVQPPVGSSYLIGGTNPGEGNVIAGNAGHGIQVAGFTEVPYGQVAILGNSIFSNGGGSIFGNELGIDLQGRFSNSFQVTRDGPCDVDEGPNGLQNYPVLTTADSAGGATTIAATLDSTPGTQFRIEFFSNPDCEASGNGEGHTFIGATTVTSAAGPCVIFPPPQPLDFGATFQPAVAVGQFITATATGPNGNTSEFSGCVQVTGTGPLPTFTPGGGATPSATGPAPTRTPAPENCYDCIDNDGDGKVDRDDEDCPLRANGMELGLSRPGKGAKGIAKCAKTLGQAGTKFSAARLKHLQKCVNAAFVCVQQEPHDAACAAKAQKTCAKELGKAAGDQGKLRKAILKTCAPPSVDMADLRSVAGIGYETEVAVCGERGVGTLASASDVVDCLLAQHRCRVEDLVASETPRAIELLALAGRDPNVEFPCLAAGADGGGGDLAGVRGKLAVKCQKGIGKAGAKFASVKAKLTQKCSSVVYACVQVKPTDPKCLPKAAATCRKQLAKLRAPGTGAAAKLAAAITKSCGKAPFALADLLESGGLGFAALGGECAALGVPSLDSLADVSSCLERRHTCRVEQMIETEMPRVEELLEVTR
jgi:PKD repeat protein